MSEEATSIPNQTIEASKSVVVTKVTADDLLDMYDQEPTDPTSEDKSSEDTKQSSNTEGEQSNDNIENEEEASEVEQEKQGEQKDASEEVAGKIKAKLGGADLDIPKDAEITQKIGKKDVTFKVSDAIKAFTVQEEFNRGMDRRVGEVSFREKRLVGNEQKLQSSYNEVKQKAAYLSKLAAQGEWLPVVKGLAKMAAGNSGVDPIEYEKACLESLNEIHRVFSGMTPEQKEIYFANRRAQASAEEANRYKITAEKNQAEREVESEIETLTTNYGLPKNKFWKLYETLAENCVGENKLYNNIGEIEPKNVIQFYLDSQHMGKIQGAVEKVSPNVLKDTAFINECFNLTKGHSDLTDADLEVIIKTAINKNSSNPTIENLNRKVAKSGNGLSTQLNQGNSKGNKDKIDEEMEEYFFNLSKRNRNIQAIARR
jgi:hypothetical protein